MSDVMLLRDPDIEPTSQVLEKVLGKGLCDIFDELEQLINSAELGLSYSWNYYKDGKAWLCKVVNGKKTIFWISVWEGYIKVSFYFTEKTRPGVFDLAINPACKDRLKQAKAAGKLIPLILDIDKKEQLKDVRELIVYKAGLK